MRTGFTLVEVMVAVTIAALLILGVSAATQSTIKSAERQKSEARQEEQRARAVELLRQDWRGRVKIMKPVAAPPAGTRILILSTTADSVSVTNARASRLVSWTASEKGLSRKEAEVDSGMLPGPVVLEFWDGVAWRPEPGGAQPAVRLVLQNPDETVVLR
jgi:prepilin-type N-terminal cleavage/methylation domain-containing protein